MMLPPGEMQEAKEALKELHRALAGLYGRRLKKAILYGSRARGDAVVGSDIDVLPVLDEIDDPIGERKRLSGIISDICLRHGVVLSVVPTSEHLFETSRRPLFLNVKREGVEL